MMGSMFQPDQLESLRGSAPSFRSKCSLKREGQGNVGLGCHAWHQVKRLKDKAHGRPTVASSIIRLEGA